MTLWHPTRRELITSAPLLLGAAALPAPLLAASPKPLRFLVVGDWGRDGAAHQTAVANRMGEVADAMGGIDFVVSTGDNFYTFGVGSAKDPQWETSFERIYTHPEMQVPWHATLGNHDYGGFAEAQIERHGVGRWKMPYFWHSRIGAKCGHPQADLFFIDTVAWQGDESWWWSLHGSKPTPERQRDQIRWLDASLAASTAPFKLVFGHHGIYSIGKHGGEKKMAELDDLLRHHRVAAYINGHDHCMYHVTHRGMDYICSGAGSEMLPIYTGGGDYGCVVAGYCEKSADGTPLFPVWQRFLAKSDDDHYCLEGGFASFEVDATSIEVKFHDSRPMEPRHCFTIAPPASAQLTGTGTFSTHSG